jgi:O-antigen/teichoic acid export membrane protein
MCSPEDFAIYINGAFEIPLIGIVSGSIAMVILADMRKMIVEGNKQEAHKLFSLSAVKAGSVLLPAMVFLFLFAGPVILLLFSNTYIESIIPFRFYLLILPVRIVFYGPALLALGKTKFILYRSLLGLIVNLVLSILLVKVFGYIGAVYATIFTLYCCNIAFSIMEISKGFECRFYEILPFVKLFKIFAWSLVPGVLIFLVYNTFLTKIPILIILPIIFIIYCLLVAGALYHMGALDVKEIKKLFTKNESKSSE